MNRYVEEVRSLVVGRIAESGTPEFSSEFVFVREDGNTHSLSIPEVVSITGSDVKDTVGVYADIVEMIDRHNQSETLKIVGLVHTAHVGELENRPHLMVIALDDKGDSIMTMFPVDGDRLREPREGTGFSPNLNPWGAGQNDKVSA